MEKEDFHEFIEKSNNIKIQKAITNELYDIIGTWRKHFDNLVFIIGLSEDKYDYYYITINNKERKLNFITCLYDLSEKSNVTKKWTTDEKHMIKSYVNDYFIKANNEKLIYLWDELE